MSEVVVENQNVNGEIEPKVTPTPVAPTIDIEDLLKKVRAEEKNKLYPQIEKLKAQLEDKTVKLNEAILSLHQKSEEVSKQEALVAELNTQIETLKTEGAKNVDNDKVVKELQKQVEKLTAQLTEKDGEAEKIRAEYELKDYRKEKLAEVDESVADLVVGNTKEEIDASIEKAKATYEKIASKFQSTEPTTPPISATVPPVNMSNVNDVFKKVDAEDIFSMTPAQYAEWRKNNAGILK